MKLRHRQRFNTSKTGKHTVSDSRRQRNYLQLRSNEYVEGLISGQIQLVSLNGKHLYYLRDKSYELLPTLPLITKPKHPSTQQNHLKTQSSTTVSTKEELRCPFCQHHKRRDVDLDPLILFTHKRCEKCPEHPLLIIRLNVILLLFGEIAIVSDMIEAPLFRSKLLQFFNYKLGNKPFYEKIICCPVQMKQLQNVREYKSIKKQYISVMDVEYSELRLNAFLFGVFNEGNNTHDMHHGICIKKDKISVVWDNDGGDNFKTRQYNDMMKQLNPNGKMQVFYLNRNDETVNFMEGSCDVFTLRMFWLLTVRTLKKEEILSWAEIQDLVQEAMNDIDKIKNVNFN